MIKFLLVLLLGGFHHQAFAASVEGLALLRTLHAKLCAEPTGEACTLLASRISTIENRAIEDLTSRVSSMSNSTAKVVALSNFLSPFVSDPEDDIDDCDDSEDIEISQKLENLLQGQGYYRKFVFNALKHSSIGQLFLSGVQMILERIIFACFLVPEENS